MKHNKIIVEDNDYTLYSSKDNVNWEYVGTFKNLHEIEKLLKRNDFSVEYFTINYYDWGMVGPGNVTTITSLILPRGSLKPGESYSLTISGNEGKNFTLYFDKYDKAEYIYTINLKRYWKNEN